eukprot:GEMP01048268.1.p1 GENE.GEMP01048268.1~~GEMP01048268.1.p1  ORF type:complete len:357 (+),score=76.14 GEMP01048268.1:138-1208(+)
MLMFFLTACLTLPSLATDEGMGGTIVRIANSAHGRPLVMTPPRQPRPHSSLLAREPIGAGTPGRAVRTTAPDHHSAPLSSRYAHSTDCSMYSANEEECRAEEDCRFSNNACVMRCLPSDPEVQCRENEHCVFTEQFGCIFELPGCSSIQHVDACQQLKSRCVFDEKAGTCTNKPCATFHNRVALCQRAGCDWVEAGGLAGDGQCRPFIVVCERVSTMLQCLDLNCHWHEDSQACRRMECADYFHDKEACKADSRCAFRSDGSCGFKTECDVKSHEECVKRTACRWSWERNTCGSVIGPVESTVAAGATDRWINILAWSISAILLLGLFIMAVFWVTQGKACVAKWYSSLKSVGTDV